MLINFNHMGDHIVKLLRLLIIPFAALVAVPALGQDKPANTMEIVREKVKADKKLLVAQNMHLTDSEAKEFWPIYEACARAFDLDRRLFAPACAIEVVPRAKLPNA